MYKKKKEEVKLTLCTLTEKKKEEKTIKHGLGVPL